MSLFFHARDIERAVLGELAPASEARLFTHLRGCGRCRARYDQLAETKAAVDGAAMARGRARARLIDALDGPGAVDATAAADRAQRRRWLPALFLLAPAAAVLVWIARPAGPPLRSAEEVTMRGAPAQAAPAATPTLVIYTSRKAGPGGRGPVRLVAELPGSGEARVSLEDYLQLGVRGLRAATHVRVVGVDARGTARDYVADTVAPPVAGVSTIGRSVDLAREHAPGSVRIVALFSPEPIDDHVVKDAVAGKGHADVVTGALVIEP